MSNTTTSPSKLSFGIALLGLGAILVFGKPQAAPEVLPEYTFESEPVKVEGFAEVEDQGNGEPKRVIIPQLQVDIAVRGARIINGYWEIFSDSAGWGKGSSLPGQVGNQVIFAHAREGLFLPLKESKEGLDVYVLTKDSWYSYKMTEVKEVLPDEIQVIQPTEDETLTLYTCSGYADSKRLIVVAKRI